MRKNLEKIAWVLLVAILVMTLMGVMLMANPPGGGSGGDDDPSGDPDDPINKPNSTPTIGWLDPYGTCRLDYALNCTVGDIE